MRRHHIQWIRNADKWSAPCRDRQINGAAARMGVRPQHLVLDPNGQLKGTVTLVERLGTETVVELRTQDGTPFRFADKMCPK